MCSNSCDDGLQKIVVDVDKLKKCKSCENATEVIVRKIDAYCGPCYEELCRHKFRATLGKTRQMKPGDKVLVWLEQTSASKMMYLLLEEAKTLDSMHKKLQFKYDYASFADQDMSSFKDSTIITLDVPDITPDQKNATSKQSYRRIHLENEFLKQSKARGYNKIFTSETGSQIAFNMLTAVSLGRGSQIQEVTSVFSKRLDTVLFRPLKEFTNEEVEQYLKVKQVPLENEVKLSNSIQLLTKTFVDGLQSEFPSTVPTIWRTADKLIASKSVSKCDVCHCNADYTGPGAMEALEISAKLSQDKSSSGDSGRILCHSCRQFIL